MAIRKQVIFLLMTGVLWAACNTTKYLPKGEALYTGASVKLNSPLSKKQRSAVKTDLQGLTRPKPNSRVLGIPVKLAIYNLFRNKKPKSLWGKLRDKYGEPPVLVSSVDVAYNVSVLQSYLENKGFFREMVTGDTVVKGKKGSANYNAQTGEQYTINSVKFDSTQGQLSKIILQSASESLLQTGKPFDLDVIKNERARIDAAAKENGFYFFSPDFLLVKADTAIGSRKTDLHVVVKPDVPEQAKEVYNIRNVYIYSNYSLNTAVSDTNKAHAQYYDGYYILDKDKLFRPILFDRITMFEPGEVYNRTDHNLTLQRLINLNVFKFVKNRFEVVPGVDSPKLDAYYYLTPLPKKSLRAELNGTQKSNNLTGSNVTFSWRNRNAFGGAEGVSLSAYVGSEVQASGSLQGYNTFRYGTELNFTFPRFIVPYANNLNRRIESGYVPRTNIQLGYDIVTRDKLFTLNQYRVGYGFLWQESPIKRHEFYPISINYVLPLNITQQYRDSIAKNRIFGRTTERQLVIGSTYQYNFNQLASSNQRTNSFYFNGLVDVSGNLLGLVTNARNRAKNNDSVRIFGTPFAQYIKFEADGRYYRKLSSSTTWANRLILGYGKPYGNSEQLPFIKQFFVGGNNSLRGFRSRSVGPGLYYDTTQTTFLPDLTGDIKLEINTELRQKLYGPLYGAVFIDAGNVWLARGDTAILQDARLGNLGRFSSKFLSQLAVDVGVGLRVDIQIFVVRFDVGFPVRKPWLSNPPYSVEFSNKQWRGENIIYNLAIGYPF